MSTRSTDVEKEQSASQGLPGTIFDEDTIQMGTASPPPTAPQPPKHADHNRRNFWLAIAAVVIVLALVFSVFALFITQPGKQTGSQTTPTTTPGTTVTTPGTDTTPAPVPGVTQGPQNGPSGVNTTAYWDNILGTKGTNSKVENVSFANMMGNSSLQALVTVRHSDANKTLDVYVFNTITSKNPTQIFKLTGLIKGEAKISYYNSILTAEVNPNSTVNAGKSVSQMTPDIFREFKWTNGAMTQVAFPGIFPVMTRYQAEAEQTRVNAGHDTWKNDAASVAKALEVQFFNWQRTVTTKVLSGGGPNDVSATVRVQEAPIQNAQPTIVVTLSRLEGNTHNMWVAIGVSDSSTLTLKNITARQSISSPVTLEGTGSAFESQIGQAVIYDQSYVNIGSATVHANTSAGTGSYSTKVSYISSFNGVQEGMVAVYQDMAGLSAENETAVMVKVLVKPNPMPNYMYPAYWTQFVSTSSATRVAESVRFGPLLGNGSWQAVVVARDVQSGPVYRDVFVFDKITDPHPQLLWQVSRLLHGDAKVSGYNTVMTSQVDANSSINTGKEEKAWTNDLFREFRWSSKSRTFEQVVFPGMFPDMTRWQAEQSQQAVMAGQNAWMLDPVQTTQHWKLIAGTAKLVKGGGPSDLTAVVNVTYPDKGGPTTNIPITQVTLSRLEGNVNGIWEITSVSADWLFIYTPKSGTTISSPVPVTGYGPQFEAVIGTVSILDHLYNGIQVGNNFAMAPDGSSPPSKFSLDVPYTSNMQGITQEGIVELSHSSGASFARGTVMAKVLINPTPSTSIQDPAYWTQFVSAPPAIRVADSVSFGHLLGNNSTQAVVVARDILGGGPVYRDVFVFDNINASQPQLLWHESRLLHGDAKISGYNTVMTAQVDANSSINTGKPEAQLTTDLFREFKWSSGAGTFVQTAFPGFYPDMTRWQAEASQIEVNAGKGTWRNDAVSVANRVASEFMNWQGTLTTKVLSGGGPNDVNATIQVQEAPIQSSQPTIVVTLSRLEGNTHNIWEAIAVTDGAQLTLTNIPAGSLISSPVTLTGTGAAFEAVIGQAVVYDHLLTTIGHAQITASSGMGIANYTIKVPYTSSFTGGAQEGVVVAYHDNGGLSSGNYSAVMVKVLIGE